MEKITLSAITQQIQEKKGSDPARIDLGGAGPTRQPDFLS